MTKRLFALLLMAVMTFSLAACSGGNEDSGADSQGSAGGTDNTSSGTPVGAEESAAEEITELTVRFGNGGDPFTLYLEDNETAAAIAEYVGQTAWQLPIYHYDDFEGWEVMQYYDIPSRYEIPSSAASVTSELAGEVYYSEPNRIVLFYHDAEISGEYTLIGHFDATEEFVTAVEENPVLEGWGNKIVQISAEE